MSRAEDKKRVDQPNLEFALRRLARGLYQTSVQTAVITSSGQAPDAVNDALDGLAEHEAKRQFVHGVGPLFVAKTKNANQLVDWSEIQNKPDDIGSGIDFDDIRIDADQVISGVFPFARLPVAELGESSADELVRANDPRLSTTTIAMKAGEPIGAGDFVTVGIFAGDDGDESRIFQANAFYPATKAIGYTTESHGVGDMVQVFPYGENPIVALPSLTLGHLGSTVFLSLTGGRASLTPPIGAGFLVQPLGTITRILSGTLAAVLVRYEYRLRLE